MISSKALIAYYRTVFYWVARLETAVSCWRAQKDVGVEYTTEERARLWEAQKKLNEAKEIFTEVWSARIGKQVALEARVEVQ